MGEFRHISEAVAATRAKVLSAYVRRCAARARAAAARAAFVWAEERGTLEQLEAAHKRLREREAELWIMERDASDEVL